MLNIQKKTLGYGIANKGYDDYKDAAEAGVANAKSGYDKLKQRFEGQGGKAKDTNL